MALSPETYRRIVLLGLRHDLVRGLISAAVLLLLLASHISFWVALPVSILTYGGLRLLVSTGALDMPGKSPSGRPRTSQDAWVLFQEARPRLGRLVAGIDDERTAAPLAGIVQRSDQIAKAISEDSQFDAAPLLLDLMETTIELLTPYAKALRRGFEPVEVNETLRRDLGILQRALDLLWEKVNQETIANFAAVSEMIEFNLEGIAHTPKIGELK